MKSASKKLLVSVVVLIIAMSLAVTSTFAWFTMSAEPKVSSFDVKVTTSDGLLISASGDPGTYKSTITKSEIETEYDIPNKQLTAVTTTNGKAFTDRLGTAATGTEYLQFTLYFKSNTKNTVKLKQSAGTSVSSDSTAVTGINRIQAWEPIDENEYGVHGAISAGQSIFADAQNAARLSFFSGTGDAIVWYPHPDIGFNKDAAATPANLATAYWNYLYPTDTITAPPAVFSLPSSDIYSDTLLTLAADATNGGFSGSLTVTIWLEGWDGDCLNSIFADTLKVALQFVGTTV